MGEMRRYGRFLRLLVMKPNGRKKPKLSLRAIPKVARKKPTNQPMMPKIIRAPKILPRMLSSVSIVLSHVVTIFSGLCGGMGRTAKLGMGMRVVMDWSWGRGRFAVWASISRVLIFLLKIYEPVL